MSVKRFNHGDIVYWCHQEGYNYSVHWGMVDEQFSDAVVVDYLVPRERRLVNGIPINEFENEQHYKKLPKGWSYNTELFQVTYSPLLDEECIDITNPIAIKTAYSKGYWVKDETIWHGKIEAEINKNRGYRIIKNPFKWTREKPTHVSIRPDRLYLTYYEARDEVNANVAELYRQAELSEYDWSVEQINKTLKFYQSCYNVSNTEIKRYQDWLFGMDRVEDIEVRVLGGNIQWKYWQNKRWLNIEL